MDSMAKARTNVILLAVGAGCCLLEAILVFSSQAKGQNNAGAARIQSLETKQAHCHAGFPQVGSHF